MTDIILCFIVWDIGVCLVPPNLLGSFGACLCRGCVAHANKLLHRRRRHGKKLRRTLSFREENF